MIIYFVLDNYAVSMQYPSKTLARQVAKKRYKLAILVTEYPKFSEEIMITAAAESSWTIQLPHPEARR